MLNDCDKEAQMLREGIKYQESGVNLKFFRRCATKVNREITNRVIKEIIRKADARRLEFEYVKEKIGYDIECIDLDARNMF